MSYTPQPQSAALNAAVAADADSLLVRPSDFTTDVAMGRINDHSIVNQFGFNADIDSAAPEIIAAQGGSIAIMTTADTLDVVSSNANDTSAGTGARTISITGIDASSNVISETVTLNGVTPVTTVNSYLGVNGAELLSSGTSNSNEGNITINDTTGTVGIQAYVPIGTSNAQQCILHIPAGCNFLLSCVFIDYLKLSAGGGNPEISVKVFCYSRSKETVYEVFRYDLDTGVNNHLNLKFEEPIVNVGNEVIYMQSSSDTNNTSLTGALSGKLIKV